MTSFTNKIKLNIFWPISFIVIYVISRLILTKNFDHNWGFNHWEFLSWSDFIIWGFLAVFFGFLLLKKNDWFYNLFENCRFTIIGSLLLFAIFIIFQTDNFIYSGGNHFISQIAQHDIVINNWYEYGSVFLISIFVKIFSVFDWHNNTSGLVSIKIVSYLGVALTLLASFKLSQLMVQDVKKRVLLFIVLFFGPQTINYFGQVGVEPIITAFIYWYAYFAYSLNQKPKLNKLIIVLLVNIVGIIFHLSLALLIPATVFLIFKQLFKTKSIPSLIAGIISYLLLIWFIYNSALENFGYAKYILFPEGLNQYRTYNLFSVTHIADILLIGLFFYPQIVFVKLYFYKNIKEVLKDSSLITISFIVLGSNSLIVIAEPRRQFGKGLHIVITTRLPGD